MSDPNAAKRLLAEARATSTVLDTAAKQLVAWVAVAEGEGVPPGELDTVRRIAYKLAHQSGRLDLIVSMAHTRAGRKKK